MESKRRTKFVEEKKTRWSNNTGSSLRDVKTETMMDSLGFRMKRESPISSRRDGSRSSRHYRSRDRSSSSDRSRSRSRSRDRSRSRERSISPFTIAMNRWTSFKEQEGKMYDYAEKKKMKYNQTPEEHPKYAEEWKQFWERRHTEVQAMGLDPDSHDYVQDWKPFWFNRCRELIAQEVEERRTALMKKYRLKSDKIPIRSDFQCRDPDILQPRNRSPQQPSTSAASYRRHLGGQPLEDASTAAQAFQDRKKETDAGTGQSNKPAPSTSRFKLVPCLRLVSAFQDNLTQQTADDVQTVLKKAVDLEKSYSGASKVLLEDVKILMILRDTATQLKQAEEQVDPDMLGSLHNCVSNLNSILASGNQDGSSDAVAVQPSASVNSIMEVALKSVKNGSAAFSVSGERDRSPPGLMESLMQSKQQDSVSQASHDRSTRGHSKSQERQERAECKSVDECLSTNKDCVGFIAESVALVLLQNGKRSFTKYGLQNLIKELMSKLQTTDKNNILGKLAQSYTTKFQQNNKKEMSITRDMEKLKFSNDELSYILENYQELSAEEGKTFDMYMEYTRRKGKNLSPSEQLLLNAYNMKSKDKKHFTAVLVQPGDADVEMKPVMFDYKHDYAKLFVPSDKKDGADRERRRRRSGSDGDARDDKKRRHSRFSSPPPPSGDDRMRRRSPLHDHRGSRHQDASARRERREDHHHGRPSTSGRETQSSPGVNLVRTALKSVRKDAKSAQSKEKKEETYEDLDILEIEIGDSTLVDTAKGSSGKNLDGSENLKYKYKDEVLNTWLRKDDMDDKPMFLDYMQDGNLVFKCNVCGSNFFGVKNVQSHYNGKKHKNRLEDEKYALFDPTVEKPRKGSGQPQ